VARAAAPRRLPQPGDRIGAFLLEEHIGAGGMGTVYRARDLCLERLVALKILPGEGANDPDVVPRFYQEARSAARLDHESIARIFSIGHDGGFHYIAFEYIEGATIRQRVQDGGPLPVGETVDYTLQIAGALVHAAERGVVHRDIKPSNLIVTPQGRVKLVDMGLARRFEREGAQPDEGLTQSGVTLGTFDYISPEQARDPRDVDVRSDLYSLGCTMFHMLAGRPPFPEGTVLQKLLQHQEEAPPDVRSVAPGVPADLAAMVLKLMAKEPDRRYQSAEQLARDLAGLAGAHGLRVGGPDVLSWLAPAPAPSWERHLVWGVPSVGLAALVALLVWWGRADDPSSPAASAPILVAPTPRAASGAGRVAAKPRPAPAVEAAGTGAGRAAAPPPVADPAPRRLAVRTDSQLEEAMRGAPSGSEIVLEEAGPFTLRAVAVAPADRPRRDLTIRAAAGLRPVLQNAPFPPGAAGEYALLAVGPGRVEIADVVLSLDAGGLDGSLAGIAARDAEMVLRGLAFRRRGALANGGRLVAVRTLQEPVAGALPEPVRVEGGHVDPQVQVLWARGPFDGWLRDCTIGPSPVTFLFDNPPAAAPVPVRLGLDQCSILAGDGVVFRLDGSRATLRVDRSVIAPTLAFETTLVAVDDPSRLTWVGRDNRYARIRTFLQPGDGGRADAAVRSFDAWAGDGAVARELDTRYGGAVWEQQDPLGPLAADPGPAFRLDEASPSSWSVGAQRGAFGPIHDLSPTAATPIAVASVNPAASGGPTSRDLAGDGDDPPFGPDDAETDLMPEPMVVARAENDGAKEREPGAALNEPPAPRAGSGIGPITPLDPAPGRTEPAPPPAPAAGAGLATADALRQALAGVADADRQVALAPGVAFELPALRLAGRGRRAIQGSDDPRVARPVLRFAPGDGMSPDEDLAPHTWWTVDGGELELRHLDLVMDGGGASASLFLLRPGSRLRLVDCTVTLEGPAGAGSALVRTPVGPDAPGDAEGDAKSRPAPVVVEVRDGLLRSGSDLFRGEHAGEFRITVTDTVAAGAGAFVQLGPVPDRGVPTDLTLDLERSALRCDGGLLSLRTAADPAPMPAVKVKARRSILSAPPGGQPLVRVEGRGRLDEAVAWLDWEGDGVVYDGFDVYRRDASTMPGSVPQLFSRGDWELALAGRDRAAYHGRVSYAQAAAEGASPWTLRPGQLRPSPESPASGAGPDFARVPAPPG
jgi:serine/threonine-protein kinase